MQRTVIMVLTGWSYRLLKPTADSQMYWTRYGPSLTMTENFFLKCFVVTVCCECVTPVRGLGADPSTFMQLQGLTSGPQARMAILPSLSHIA